MLAAGAARLPARLCLPVPGASGWMSRRPPGASELPLSEGRRGFGVRYDGGGQRCSAGKAADKETWLSEFLRDVVDDLREKIELLETDPAADAAPHGQNAAMRRRTARAVASEENDALQARVLELEAENSNLAGLLETITDALEEQEARCAAAEARADRLEQQLSIASEASSSAMQPPPSALRSASRSRGSGGTALYGTRTADTTGAAGGDLDTSSRHAKQLALLQLANQAAARTPSAGRASDAGEGSGADGQQPAGGSHVHMERQNREAGSTASDASSVGSSPESPRSPVAPALPDTATGASTGAASTSIGTVRAWQQDQLVRRERLAFLLSAKASPTTGATTTEPAWGAVAASGEHR